MAHIGVDEAIPNWGVWGTLRHVIEGPIQGTNNQGIDVTLPDYGAAGDGITDDTDAIAAAIAAAATGPKVVLLPAGTFRTSDWIDIDGIDDLTIRGMGKQATIIKPGDGADCGGFRVGNTTACNRVVIEGVGFDGNYSTMTAAVKRLDGFVFDNAADCVLRDFYATQTHPYHEHNTGGSGVSLRANATGIIIERGLIDDIGDRGIQMAGSGHIVRHNVIRNGYDRGVSLDIYLPGDTWDGADDCKIHDNVISDHSSGSCISVREYAASRNSVQNNRLLGTFRGAVQFDNTAASNNLIQGNFVRHTDADLQQHCFVGGPYTHVVGNTVIDVGGAGANFDRLVENKGSGAAHFVIRDNYFDCGGNVVDGCVRLIANNGEVVNNTFVNWGADDAGVAIAVFATETAGYRIHGNKGHTDNAAASWIQLGNGNGILTSNYLSDHYTTGTFSAGVYDITGTPDLSADNYPAPT